ncbi:MAG: ATP-binding protein [Pseudomonadales bacterium]|nr:hypothetical protein [Pseudomonadales bacterium]
MKAGIQTRLLVITTVVLGTFLSLAGVVLDRSFRASVLDSAEEQLRLVIYSLMGAVNDSAAGFSFGGELPEPRLNQPESGLYARINAFDGRPDWLSPSAITTGVNFPADGPLRPGEFRFEAANGSESAVGRFFLSYAVIWEESADALVTFSVGTDQRPFLAAIDNFRRNLYIGLGAVTLFFVLAQYLAVRWGLRPLRTMASEISELEEGRRDRLSADYPVEVQALAVNLDRFVEHERRSRSRYRKAMEDLAHSLKTPLAVIRNELASRDPAQALLCEQLDRMESTVTHQLSRAAVTGPVVVGRPVPLATLVERLLRALRKAYADRTIEVEVRIPGTLNVRGDERDLMEMLGNLIDNAFKYTQQRVRISASGSSPVVVVVEDDGAGIPVALREEVLNRGTRADEIQTGQGIGLAMVQELVSAYGGSIAIGASALGGAAVSLRLP